MFQRFSQAVPALSLVFEYALLFPVVLFSFFVSLALFWFDRRPKFRKI
jgi:hypothetical protein